MRKHRAGRNALLFICITVLIDTIGFSIIIPVTPALIMELTGQGLSNAALFGGWLLFSYALMQFFFAPVLGGLSDRFGRRPVLLTSLFGFGVNYVLMGLAPTIAWLFLGRMVAGIFGATGATANAYIADVSPPEERAQNFGLIGAAWGFGFIIGPALGGVLGGYGARVPFFAAAGLALVNTVYGYFVLPETLSVEKRRSFSLKRANPFAALANMRRYPVVVGLFGSLLLYQVAQSALPSTWTFYTMLKFDWSVAEVGYSMAFVGLLSAFVQGVLIRHAIARIGERSTVYFGLAMMTLGFLGFALAGQGAIMYVFLIPFALSGLAMPALRSIVSSRVPADGQGELHGAITSLFSLTAIVAPVVMTHLFGFFTADEAAVYFPGAPFMLATVMTIGCALVFVRAMRAAQ